MWRVALSRKTTTEYEYVVELKKNFFSDKDETTTMHEIYNWLESAAADNSMDMPKEWWTNEDFTVMMEFKEEHRHIATAFELTFNELLN